MTDSPWIGDMTAEERVDALHLNLRLGPGVYERALTATREAIRDAEHRARAKAIEEAACKAESHGGIISWSFASEIAAAIRALAP